jgi:sensor histidine kinase regulating citrate/malate metabolism
MVLNALESTQDGDAVRVALTLDSGSACVKVINPGEMPRKIQLQVFQRSFSTKGVSGRGLGTYSMKLLGERYLGGTVDFQCDNGETIFSIKLPLEESPG